MKRLFYVFFLLFLPILTEGDDGLQLVQILFRHGERSPSRTYRNDPHSNYPWPNGWNQLVNRGKRQMYDFGLVLRKTYARFLSEYYFPNETYVLSSYADRCHMSAQMMLAGLYPPVKEQIWNSELLWQPIPVHGIFRHSDKIIAMKKPCPKYEKALADVYMSDRISKVDEENAELYSYLTGYTGDNITNLLSVETLYNTLQIEEMNNLTLPTWTKEVYPHRMKDNAALSLAVFTETDFMKRIKGGVFIKDIISHMEKKRKTPSARKLYLYSGHDISLVNVIRTLGIEDLLKPGFGASLTFEMYKIDEKYIVKILYRDNSTAEPTEFKLSSCHDPCELDNFSKAMEPLIPIDWDEECTLEQKI